jgi:hypothetical protein
MPAIAPADKYFDELLLLLEHAPSAHDPSLLQHWVYRNKTWLSKSKLDCQMNDAEPQLID